MKVCIEGTWGRKSDRICVETTDDCGLNSQWADNSTNLCVDTCPVLDGTFGNFDDRMCVPVCPNETFADDLSRTCVTRCPENNGIHDTFGNNETHICEENCQEPNTYADPQTLNRYCVTECSQSPA